MKGYKAFNNDLTCRGFQFEIGQEYIFKDKPIPCKQGFHFCKKITDCYQYYPMSEDTRICEVEAIGDIETDDGVKYCTNKIVILNEIEHPLEVSNSGENNLGSFNSGHCNLGNFNSGNFNSGDWNSGDFNSGNHNSGIFCTEINPKIKLFDKESNWRLSEWLNSDALKVMIRCPYIRSVFVGKDEMTDEEKIRYPEYETIGGCMRESIATDEDRQKWWDGLPKRDKQTVCDLPNFDPEKFKQCIGIEVRKND